MALYSQINTFQGYIQKSDASWATCRGASSGDTAVDNPTNSTLIYSRLTASYFIRRSFYVFDTSSLGAGATITAAELVLYGNGIAPTNDNSDSAQIVLGTPASPSTLVTADYDNIGATSFSSMAFSSFNSGDGQPNTFTLNADGLAAINKTGNTIFAFINGTDFTNTAPGGDNHLNAYPLNSAGQKPTLNITYTSGGGVDTTKFFF